MWVIIIFHMNLNLGNGMIFSSVLTLLTFNAHSICISKSESSYQLIAILIIEIYII
jgi:uncharacterized membrane protein YGL010W